MIKRIRAALDAIAALPAILQAGFTVFSEAIEEAFGEPTDLSPLMDRMDQIERGNFNTLAEVEALVHRAESQLKAARASEERARGMEKRAQRLAEDVDDGDEEGQDPFLDFGLALQRGNGEGSPGSGVREVPGDVEPRLTGKAAARAFKWGRL